MFDVVIPDETDADRISSIHLAAMEPNILLHAQFPTEQSRKSLHEFLRSDTILHIRDPTKGALVAQDAESKNIVAFIKWELPNDSVTTNQDQELDWPGDSERKYVDEYYNLSKEAERDAIGKMRCCHISFLCAEPAWQGRGVGSLLAREVLDRVREENLPVYLESTLEAVQMYKKIGFSQVDGFQREIPHRDSSTGHAVYKEICLLWSPDPERD